jgi:hypothetical protein
VSKRPCIDRLFNEFVVALASSFPATLPSAEAEEVANRVHIGGEPAPTSLVFRLESMLGAQIMGMVLQPRGSIYAR